VFEGSKDAPPRSFWLALAGVVVLAIWARLTVWQEVFIAGEVLTRDPDADYHLLRIARTLESFPHVPVLDPRLNWPQGGPCPWAPGFDWLGALFAMLLGVGDDLAAIERAIAFYPVALGVALVCATVAFARLLLPAGSPRDGMALCAGALVAVLPRSVTASSLGRVDHHVFEALAYVLLGAWALRAVRAATKRERLPLAFEAHGAFVISLAGAGFTGSILYAGLAAALVIATRLARPRSDSLGWVGSGAPAFALSACALLFFYAPAIREHGQAWDFRLASLVQPALHAALAFGCGAAVLVNHFGPAHDTARARVKGRLLWLGGVALVAAAAMAPWVGEPVWRGAHDWIATQDPWLASIDEFQPLYRAGDWRSLLDFNGWPGLLAPLVIPIALVWLARRDRAMAWAFGFWLLTLAPLALLRTRFATPATPAFAVASALALCALTHLLSRRALPIRPALASALVAIALLAVDPASRAMLQWRPERRLDAIESVTLALRELPDPGTPRGALAIWSFGHSVLRLGQRPVLTAGFGHWTGAEAFHASETFMQGDVDELMHLMETRELGFVITGMNAPFPAAGDRPGDPHKPFVLQGERVVWNAPYFHALPLTPLVVGGSGDPELGIAHVPTLMPQFASEHGAPGMGFPLQRLWLYERVPGATLTGEAPPASVVVADTELEIWGQPTRYRAWARADAAGRYEIVVPLPNGHRSDALRTGPHTALYTGGQALGRVQVREEQIRAGDRITVAPLRLQELATRSES
jgi:hypothetical protein